MHAGARVFATAGTDEKVQLCRDLGAHVAVNYSRDDFAAVVLDEGVYVIGFSYPVVPQGKARIRVQLSAAHTDEQIDQTIKAFAKVGRALGVQ